MRLNAPPVDGRANAALVEYLSKTFSVPRARIRIESGLTGRDKRIRISEVGNIPSDLTKVLGLG